MVAGAQVTSEVALNHHGEGCFIGQNSIDPGPAFAFDSVERCAARAEGMLLPVPLGTWHVYQHPFCNEARNGRRLLWRYVEGSAQQVWRVALLAHPDEGPADVILI